MRYMVHKYPMTEHRVRNLKAGVVAFIRLLNIEQATVSHHGSELNNSKLYSEHMLPRKQCQVIQELLSKRS